MHSWIKLLCTTMLDHSVDSTDTLSWAWETGYLVLSDFTLHIHFFWGGGCSHEGLLVCSYMYNNRALIENATNWQTYKSIDTLELFVYVYTLDNLSLYDMYLYVCIVYYLFSKMTILMKQDCLKLSILDLISLWGVQHCIFGDASSVAVQTCPRSCTVVLYHEVLIDSLLNTILLLCLKTC